MTFEDAAITARDAMARDGRRRSLVQVNNGQWMVEDTSFLDSPQGRMIYGDEKRLDLHAHQEEPQP